MPGTIPGVKEKAGHKTEFFAHIALSTHVGPAVKQPLGKLYSVYSRK